MKDLSQQFKKVLVSLLNERLSEQEEQSLKDDGFALKKPTRKYAVMIALYKKAVSGDLSAIKELRSIISDGKSDKGGSAVVIIDDITN